MKTVETKYVTIKTHAGQFRRYRDTAYHLPRIQKAREVSLANPGDKTLSDSYEAEYKALYGGYHPIEGLLV